MEKKSIIGVETPNFIYISYGQEYSGGIDSIFSCFFGRQKAERTYHREWLKIPNPMPKVEIMGAKQFVNKRYELIDMSFVSEKAPAIISHEDAMWYDKEECEWAWNPEYKHLASLYQYKYDEIPAQYEDVELTYKCVAKLGFDILETNIEYAAPKEWNSYNLEHVPQTVGNGSVKWGIMDRVVLPAPLLDLQPCELSSQDSYKIVRQFVKLNIDPEWAQITSDYDFCFTVKKKILLDAPFNHTYEEITFGKSRRKPKMVTKYVKSRMVDIFEMTHNECNYKGYTVLEGFKGENKADLKEKVDAYLTNLIAEINAPLIECSCCGGLGVTGFKK